MTTSANSRVRRRISRARVDGIASSQAIRYGLLVVVGLFLFFNPYQKSYVNMGLGIVLLLLSLWPLDVWLRRRGRRDVPVFELHLLFYALCFGFAAFVKPARYMGGISVSEPVYTVGLIAAILGVVALTAGYALSAISAGRLLGRFKPRFPSRIGPGLLVIAYAGLLVLCLVVPRFGLGALLQPAGYMRLFVFTWLVCMAFGGAMPVEIRRLVLFLLVPAELLLLGGLADGKLAGLLIYGQLLGVAFVVTRGRIPVVATIAVAVAFLVLQPVKSSYRQIVWVDQEAVGDLEGIGLFVTLGVQAYLGDGRALSIGDEFDEAYTRLNHLHATAAVIRDTPDVQPYRHGETLIPLLTKWVPRTIWQDKPIEDFGNRWARDYGYLNSFDFVTAFNLPWLPEMYINFGWAGVVIISLMAGWLIGEFVRGCVWRDRSFAGLAFSLVIGSTFFFPESNISLQIGGLIVGWISIYLLTLAARLVFIERVRPRGQTTGNRYQ